MSKPSDIGGTQSFCDRQQLAKKLEKSNFAQTCSLLSQFLKEKRSHGDLSIDNSARKKARDELAKPESLAMTMILPKGTANSVDTSKRKDILPRFAGFPPSGSSDNAAKKGEFRIPAKPEPTTAQMTIFYGGKVMVYNDFPNDRAEEIMALANKGGRSRNSTGAPATTVTPNRSGSAHPASMEKPSSCDVAGEPNVVSKTQSAGLNKPTQDQPPKPQPEAKNSELPIARRASLHRFLEKRKDRAVARAPHELHQQPEAPYKASGSSSRGEAEHEPAAEEDFPRQLDLNL